MKTRILAKVSQDNGVWIAAAYFDENEYCRVVGASDIESETTLKAALKVKLDAHAGAWLAQWRHGGDPDSPNCPEGAVKLPIDLWVCKLFDAPCPLQAQVLLREPDNFNELCLADPERKRGIFDAVASGEYSGFHHVPGRLLCVWCEAEGKKGAFSYHYPWEMTHLTAFFPFPEKEVWKLHRQLTRRGAPGSAAYCGLCAQHCKHLVEMVAPATGAELRVLELEVFRPSGATPRAT